jgi:Mn2+/Fe2+ NRAMP family transporter
MKKHEKRQNDLMRDLFTRHEVYEPSSSFTDKVMYRVSVEKRYDTEIYRPVISRTAWIIITFFIAALVFLSVYYGTEGTGYLDRIFSHKIDLDYNIPEISGILQKISHFFSTTSSVVLYIITGLLAMTGILMAEPLWQRRLVSKK